jgi:hypothetical protein
MENANTRRETTP